MPRRDPRKDAFALKNFRKRKVLVVEELAELLASSLATTRRRLKEWHAYTSYNRNGRYYVLPDVAKFDQHGLWRYKTIFFSKLGNLRKTVIHLVRNSPAGLTGAEIGELVGLAPRSFLSHFRDEPAWEREKLEARFVYFSSDKPVLAEQRQKRQEQSTTPLWLPTEAEAVVILVERIKHPEASIEDLSVLLRKKGSRFSVGELCDFLRHHGLLKKTPDMPR